MWCWALARCALEVSPLGSDGVSAQCMAEATEEAERVRELMATVAGATGWAEAVRAAAGGGGSGEAVPHCDGPAV